MIYIKRDWTEVHRRIIPKGIVPDSRRLGLWMKEGGGCEVGGDEWWKSGGMWDWMK